MRAPSMHLAHWHPAMAPEAPVPPADVPFVTHLHGRDLVVEHELAPPHWHWRVATPHGLVLAEGDAETREAAEVAAEDEATAVHPPTDALLEKLLS